MENLLLVGAVSLATPVVATAIITLTTALEERGAARLEEESTPRG